MGLAPGTQSHSWTLTPSPRPGDLWQATATATPSIAQTLPSQLQWWSAGLHGFNSSRFYSQVQLFTLFQDDWTWHLLSHIQFSFKNPWGLMWASSVYRLLNIQLYTCNILIRLSPHIEYFRLFSDFLNIYIFLMLNIFVHMFLTHLLLLSKDRIETDQDPVEPFQVQKPFFVPDFCL